MTQKNKTWLIVGVVALVLVCTAAGTLGGLFVGGMAGYYAGRRSVEGLGYRPSGPSAPVQTPEWNFQWPEGIEPPSVQAGARISRVIEGSPAEQAGLRVGDLIVAVDGQSLAPAGELAEAVAGHRPGDMIELIVESQGQQRRVTVILGENPDSAGKPYLGVSYRMEYGLPGDPDGMRQ